MLENASYILSITKVYISIQLFLFAHLPLYITKLLIVKFYFKSKYFICLHFYKKNTVFS